MLLMERRTMFFQMLRSKRFLPWEDNAIKANILRNKITAKSLI